jgi:hypothetical protein
VVSKPSADSFAVGRRQKVLPTQHALIYIYSDCHRPYTHSRQSCVPKPEVHVFIEIVKVMVLGPPRPVEGSDCNQVSQQGQNNVLSAGGKRSV